MDRSPNKAVNDITKAAILAELISCINTPYIWQGNNPLQGMDCSGYACWVLKSFGLVGRKEDFSAADLAKKFASSGRKANQDEFGAMLFFGKKEITHVAFALGSGRMIESGGGDSSTTNQSLAAQRDAMVRRRMISARQDLVQVIMPPWPDLDFGI